MNIHSNARPRLNTVGESKVSLMKLASLSCLVILLSSCRTSYDLVRASIPTAYGLPKAMHVEVECPSGWKTNGPAMQEIAFLPENCVPPGCPLITVVLYAQNPYNPMSTPAECARSWLKDLGETAVVKEAGDLGTAEHRGAKIYHFSSQAGKQLVVYLIYRDRLVAVTLRNFAGDRFQPYMRAFQQVASSVRYEPG